MADLIQWRNRCIFRSLSYQPPGSRVAGCGGKPVSNLPNLTDIFAGKILGSTNSPASGASKASKSPHHQSMCSNRTSSSSLASLGEDPVVTAEMQAVSWNAPTSADGALPYASAFRPLMSSSSLSPAPLSSSSSPSPSLTLSRPTSVLSQKELLYAELDLPPSSTAFRPEESSSSSSEVPRSPRSVRACSSAELSSTEAALAPTVYAQIDFQKSEGLKNVSSGSRELLRT